VEHLGTAMRRVQEIAGQVQVVSQRATLVALHAVTLESRLPREERRGEDLSHELRLLTGEVRAAAQHADQLAADVERETRAADERMRSLRERVAPRLEPPAAESPEAMLPAPATAASPASATPADAAAQAAALEAAELSDHSVRLLDRVREMVQDAAQKGERLSAAGERAARAADRLLRRLEDETRDVEGLMVRLSPAGELPMEMGHDLDDDAMSAPMDLRLLASETIEGRTEMDPPGRGAREERP
ncbi:MAG: hypothetical protein ABIS67_04900, partial [Candidatus Eisenbacteria bacterium]